MPEGPEIRLAADRIADAIAGRRLEQVQFAFPELRRYERRLQGVGVRRVDTRGKAMLTRFDNGLTLYSHNQLYGRWYVTERGRLPSTARSLRVALHTAETSALLYSASDVEMLDEEGLRRHPFLSRLGPDILDDGLEAADIAARLQDGRFAGRATGSLYLDQGFLAGVGNYLRSEILFSAGVHPSRRPRDLGAQERGRLARETLAVSRRSYRTGGITLPRSRARELKRRGLGYEQSRFWVFGRAGAPCRRCGETVQRTELSSRGLFLCPGCQPAG